MRGQCVEDGGLLDRPAVTQMVLDVPQQKRSAITIRYRINLACRQFLQAS